MIEGKHEPTKIQKKIEKESTYFNIFDDENSSEHILIDFYNQVNQMGKDFEIPEFTKNELIKKVIQRRDTIRPKKPKNIILDDEEQKIPSYDNSPFNTPPQIHKSEIPFPSVNKTNTNSIEIPKNNNNNNLNMNPNKNPFDESPKNSPKNVLMEYNTPGSSPINSFSESPKNSPSTSFFSSPKNSPKNSPMNSPRKKGSKIMSKKNAIEENKAKKYYFWDFIKSSIFHNPKTEDGFSFHDLIKELGEDIKKTQELINDVVSKSLFEIFASYKQKDHVKGTTWTNFGENLKCKAKFIFSDDTEKPVGYLIHKNNKFHLETKSGEIVNIKFKAEECNQFNSPITIDHLKAITKLAEKYKCKIKTFGSSHSWSPIHTSNGILVDNRKINYYEGIQTVQICDQDPRTGHPSISANGKLQPTVTCSPGITSGALEVHLWELTDKKDKRYSLESSTIEEVFTIGGIAFTSSHGTGKNCCCISDSIIAMTIVGYNGEVIKITPTECPNYLLYDEKRNKDLTPEDVWRAAQVNLGAFGIVYDMTILIQPQIDAYFVTEVPRWDKYFGDNEKAREELFRLNNEWDTLEFWHYPLTYAEKVTNITLKDILFSKVTSNPHVIITKTMTNRAPVGYTIIEKKPIDFYSTLLFQTVGARFSYRMWKWAVNSKIGKHFRGNIVAFSSFGVQKIFGDEEKKICWKVPQFVANHPVINATTVVEHIPCLDIEWEVKCDWTHKDGLKHAANLYRHLCESVAKSFQKNEFPVSINVEMRFLRGSASPISHQYIPGQSIYGSQYSLERKDIEKYGFAAPEIVTHSPNPFWEEFYNRMNKDIMRDKEQFGTDVRCHWAKQYASIKGMLKYLRNVYDSERSYPYPYELERRKNFKYNTAFKLWKEVRNRFDPDKVFMNPFIEQFFYTDYDTYVSPENDGYLISEGGNINAKHCVIL